MIGLEPTFDEHLANLVDVFREVLRVLRPDGVCWLNYGDAYAHSQASGGGSPDGPRSGRADTKQAHSISNRVAGTNLKPKDLMFMPARVAMALQADGWWVRSKIIWHKPNPMPESVTDRPTSSYEEVFLLTKASRYFYDAEAVRVPHLPSSLKRYESGLSCNDSGDPNVEQKRGELFNSARMGDHINESGANLRNVWTIPTQGFSESHYATFPTKLVETCIKAGTSERGCCGVCGAPWERTVDVQGRRGESYHAHDNDLSEGQSNSQHAPDITRTTTGWQPTCSCDAETKPCVVLDCFGGAGTVGLVAQRLGRDSILIEISPEYAEMSRRRINDDMPLFAQVEAESQPSEAAEGVLQFTL